MAPQKVTGMTTNCGMVNLETHNYVLEFERCFSVKVWGSVGPPTGVKLCDLAKASPIGCYEIFLAKKSLQKLRNTDII